MCLSKKTLYSFSLLSKWFMLHKLPTKMIASLNCSLRDYRIRSSCNHSFTVYVLPQIRRVLLWIALEFHLRGKFTTNCNGGILVVGWRPAAFIRWWLFSNTYANKDIFSWTNQPDFYTVVLLYAQVYATCADTAIQCCKPSNEPT